MVESRSLNGPLVVLCSRYRSYSTVLLLIVSGKSATATKKGSEVSGWRSRGSEPAKSLSHRV